MKKIIPAYLLGIIAVLLYAYVELPVLKPDFITFYVIIIGFLALTGFLMMDQNNILNISKVAKGHFILAALLGIVVVIVPFITSTPLLHADAYRSLIGEVKASDFTKDISPVSVEDIRLVDKETAIRLGDKKMGEVPGLGSIARLGDFHIQSVENELFWVAPLVHRDLIKWATNLDGTTGYIMVSATNPQDVRFIQTLDDKPVKIVYQPDAYLHQDLARHVYLSGLMNVGLTDFTFEIDDAGAPYWVVTLYEHAIGFSGGDAIGVATVHATTGEVSTYAIEEAPEWIDRIQPESFITSQLTSWGIYVDGFLNSRLAQANVLVPTPGTSLVYGEDGRSYWYTGMTSAGADEATIGFILVDTRTKEARLYKQPGATETAAMSSATGKVQEKGYKATFPVMYNILGTPTYVMSLKDNAGLIKMVAFVSVEDYSLLGVGDTKEIALRNYKEALKSKGNSISIGGATATTKSLTGTLTRINADVQNGMTYYYFTLDTNTTTAFVVTSALSKEIPLSQVGDKVTLTYDSYGDDRTIDVITFDNQTLTIQ
ncbi:MAG: hypothetical protein ACRCWY_07390 [Cellulosilyticaceae bacterium]